MIQSTRRFLDRLAFTLKHRFSLGARGERIAARFLRKQGYRILARNLRLRLGEVDLLAESPDARHLVVVEVKTASNPAIPPELRVGKAKQRKLISLASSIARQAATHNKPRQPLRFDVIGVDLPRHGKPTIRHHPNAFQAPF